MCWCTIFYLVCISSQELSEIHVGFHSQLRKACSSQSSLRLSEVFINWREKFLIYGDYCANLTLAQSTIQDVCEKNDTINQEVIVSYISSYRNKFTHQPIISSLLIETESFTFIRSANKKQTKANSN